MFKLFVLTLAVALFAQAQIPGVPTPTTDAASLATAAGQWIPSGKSAVEFKTDSDITVAVSVLAVVDLDFCRWYEDLDLDYYILLEGASAPSSVGLKSCHWIEEAIQDLVSKLAGVVDVAANLFNDLSAVLNAATGGTLSLTSVLANLTSDQLTKLSSAKATLDALALDKTYLAGNISLLQTRLQLCRVRVAAQDNATAYAASVALTHLEIEAKILDPNFEGDAKETIVNALPNNVHDFHLLSEVRDDTLLVVHVSVAVVVTADITITETLPDAVIKVNVYLRAVLIIHGGAKTVSIDATSQTPTTVNGTAGSTVVVNATLAPNTGYADPKVPAAYFAALAGASVTNVVYQNAVADTQGADYNATNTELVAAKAVLDADRLADLATSIASQADFSAKEASWLALAAAARVTLLTKLTIIDAIKATDLVIFAKYTLEISRLQLAYDIVRLFYREAVELLQDIKIRYNNVRAPVNPGGPIILAGANNTPPNNTAVSNLYNSDLLTGSAKVVALTAASNAANASLPSDSDSLQNDRDLIKARGDLVVNGTYRVLSDIRTDFQDLVTLATRFFRLLQAIFPTVQFAEIDTYTDLTVSISFHIHLTYQAAPNELVADIIAKVQQTSPYLLAQLLGTADVTVGTVTSGTSKRSIFQSGPSNQNYTVPVIVGSGGAPPSSSTTGGSSPISSSSDASNLFFGVAALLVALFSALLM